jgi:hypothetical protein
MEEQEEERHAEALVGKTICIATAVAFEEAVSAELADIVPELVEPVLLGGELEPGHDGVMEFCAVAEHVKTRKNGPAPTGRSRTISGGLA